MQNEYHTHTNMLSVYVLGFNMVDGVFYDLIEAIPYLIFILPYLTDEV